MTHLVQDFRDLRLDEWPGHSFSDSRHSRGHQGLQRGVSNTRGSCTAPPFVQELGAGFGGCLGRNHGRYEQQPPLAQHSRGTLSHESAPSYTWQATQTRRDQDREREYARARALSQQRRRRPMEPIGYPWNVARAEVELESSSLDAIAATSRLWIQIMAYWFPSRAGFTVVENWSPPDPENRWLFNPVQADLAVMWHGSESPVAVVQIHPPEDPEERRDLVEVKLKESADKVFERAAMWSSHPRLLMVSALGSRWNAFMGSTDLTNRDGLVGEGSDWFGPKWDDKVTSRESFQVMSFCVAAIKSYLSVPS